MLSEYTISPIHLVSVVFQLSWRFHSGLLHLLPFLSSIVRKICTWSFWKGKKIGKNVGLVFFIYYFHLIFCTFSRVYLCYVFVRLLFKSTVLGYLMTFFLWLNQSSSYACHTIRNLYCLNCLCCWWHFFPYYLKDPK